MKLRKAELRDIEEITKIYDTGRMYMRSHGNLNQWINGYPSRQQIYQDIEAQDLYVVEEAEELLGVFYFLVGHDPTYDVIYEGSWLNDEPYGVIHRIASAGKRRGIGLFCIDWAMERTDNLRVDTHKDNLTMQNMLISNGFSYCGIIICSDGTPRLAYQKTRR